MLTLPGEAPPALEVLWLRVKGCRGPSLPLGGAPVLWKTCETSVAWFRGLIGNVPPASEQPWLHGKGRLGTSSALGCDLPLRRPLHAARGMARPAESSCLDSEAAPRASADDLVPPASDCIPPPALGYACTPAAYKALPPPPLMMSSHIARRSASCTTLAVFNLSIMDADFAFLVVRS